MNRLLRWMCAGLICVGGTVCVFAGEDPVGFKRGDADGNNDIQTMVDAIFLLDYGFNQGLEPPCLDAADVDGNNAVEPIADALTLLNYQFSGGPPPAAPFPNCGEDDDLDETVTCLQPLCTLD